MLASLGHEPTALGVARLYAPLARTFLLDRADAALADAVAELGIKPRVEEIVMVDSADRRRVAAAVLAAVG
jgi:LPPG:FO 2-phospho-L-lactate transferase